MVKSFKYKEAPVTECATSPAAQAGEDVKQMLGRRTNGNSTDVLQEIHQVGTD